MPVVEKIKKYSLSHLYLDTRKTLDSEDVTLSRFLKTNQAFMLTSMQCEVMALQLIRAVKILHELNIVHQGICRDNVRVLQTLHGEFYLKLGNFTYAYDSESPEEGDKVNDKAHAAIYYESPEIASIAKKNESVKDEGFISYGQRLSKNIQPLAEYTKPDSANDMWALGILIYYLFYKNHPIEDAQTEFPILLAGLLNPNKKERLTIEQALKLQEERVKQAKADNKLKIEAFFERIADRKKENLWPVALREYIQPNELNSIYVYVLAKKLMLTKELEQKKACRFDKKFTGLARTLNLIFDPKSEEVLLILETKSKNEQGAKVTNHEVFNGTSKKTKLAWAIDEKMPQKFANSVSYIADSDSLLSAKIEAAVSERITAHYGTTEVGINRASLGCQFNKKGEWRGNSYVQKFPLSLQFLAFDAKF
jgi:serine/threonine protein kinase